MEKRHPCFETAASQQELDDLRLAHASSVDTPLGDPISHETLESARLAAVHSFMHWPVREQLDFLSDLPADEAALILERVDAQVREELFLWLPPDLRQALDTRWGATRGTWIST